MTRSMRTHLTLPNVLSVVAVFAALGGTSYAAVQVSRNTVGASQIKTGGVGSSEVKNGTLRKADLRASDLPTGPIGPVGLAGSRGAKGDRGDKGDTGHVGVVQATVQFTTAAAAGIPEGGKVTVNSFCPAGEQAIGGGFQGDRENPEETNTGSARPAKTSVDTEPPNDNGAYTGWRVTTANPTGGIAAGLAQEVWVICAPLPPP